MCSGGSAVDYGCLSCGAKYAIPDTRVQKAGVDGLRVRCSRCRAIMAVSSNMAGTTPTAPPPRAKPSANDVSAAHAGVSSSSSLSWSSSSSSSPSSSPSERASGPVSALVTGVMRNPFADVAAPAAMSANGLQSAQGVSREVTGVFMGLLASALDGAPHGEFDAAPTVAGEDDLHPTPERRRRIDVFYAAIEGRARGPFSSREMLVLAEKGKIRAGTLLWKSGASGWKPLKHVVDFDVSFLVDAVRTRKRREREAELLSERRLGIMPVRLERQTVRPLLPDGAGSARRANAPALPFDAYFDDVDAGNAPASAFHGFGNSSVGGELSAASLTPSSWRAPAGRPRASSSWNAVPSRVVVAATVVGTLLGVAIVVAGVSALGFSF